MMAKDSHWFAASSEVRKGPSLLSDGMAVAPPKLSLDYEDSLSNGVITLSGTRLPLF